MSTNDKQSQFLDALNNRTSFPDTPHFERALYFLLFCNKDKIFIPDDDPSWFHKSFLQTDVTGSAELDIAIWYLLSDSKIVWEVLDKVYNNVE